jgi:branched-chain amino acid transport system permease protein
MSGGVLGGIGGVVASAWGTLPGQIALLVTAIVIIRVLPEGLTGLAGTIKSKLGVSDYGT